MTAGSLPELDAATLIERIASDDLPRDFVLLAARGFLPIEQNDLVGIVAFLTGHEDAEIGAAARETLSGMPLAAVTVFAASPISPVDQLRFLAAAATDPMIVEALLRNRTLPDDVMVSMVETIAPQLQDVVVTNQERIIRHPEILEALLRNPRLTPDARRRAVEIRTEFFEKVQRAPAPAVTEEEKIAEIGPAEEALMQELMKKAAEIEASASPAAKPSLSPVPLDEDDSGNMFFRLVTMNASEKVQVAFKGGRTERSILVRDRNKMVCSAVLRSPRITESEVESFAAMRNLEEEVLRIIGMNREWTSKYPILLNLVRNPKAPLGVVLPLINRLTLRDLKTLSFDRNVPEGVRSSSRKLFKTRNAK